MWTCIGQLTIASGRVSLSDSSFFFDFPLIVELPPGTYSMEVLRATLHGDELIERLRIVDVGPPPLLRGELLGFVRVEFAQLAVCDRTAAEAAFSQLDEHAMNLFAAQFSLSRLTGVATFPDGTKMYLLKPGPGDLDCAVFELLRGPRRCGIEAAFVEPEARRPP